MTLLAAALADDNLFEAWRKVRSNGGAAGSDGQSLDAFAHNVFGRLQTLRHLVERNEYRPLPLLQYAIPKPDGGERLLAVPCVRDRVVQTAVTRILAPLLEHEFEHASYAYRAGRSVQMAVARVAHYRDQGYRWVVDADIQHFFDEVSHPLLLDKLRRSLGDHSLLPLIELWLAATVQPVGGQAFLLERGVPQGSPLSPLLANLYLDDFDEALLDENLRLVRFADDFLILCRDADAAAAALELTESAIGSLQLQLNRNKTRITRFEDGFRFLGVDFIRNLMTPAEPGNERWVLPDAEQQLAAATHHLLTAHLADAPADADEPDDPHEPDTSDDDTSDDYAKPATQAPPAPGHTTRQPIDPAPDHSDPPDGILIDIVAAPPDTPEHNPTVTARVHATTRADHNSQTRHAPDAEPDQPEPPESTPSPHAPYAHETDRDDGCELIEDDSLSPVLRSFYITEQGLTLLKDNERVLVCQRHDVRLSHPLGKLDEIVILGNALVSTALLRHCVRSGIQVHFADPAGNMICTLDNGAPTRLDILRAQQNFADNPALVQMVARELVSAKIHNQRLLLRRYNRRRKINDIELAELLMARLVPPLSGDLNLEQLRGYEGQAARLYFGALGRLVPESWQFNGRRKRPAPDPFNALLSLGYGMLHKTMDGFIRRRHLSPWLGNLHRPRAGHPALASDLIEAFRAPIIDTCMLQLVLDGQITPADFIHEQPARPQCQLTTSARKRVVAAVARKLRAQLAHPVTGTRMDYQRALLYQVTHYRRVVERIDPVYTEFRLR